MYGKKLYLSLALNSKIINTQTTCNHELFVFIIFNPLVVIVHLVIGLKHFTKLTLFELFFIYIVFNVLYEINVMIPIILIVVLLPVLFMMKHLLFLIIVNLLELVL